MLDEFLISYDSKLIQEDSIYHFINKYGKENWSEFYNYIIETSPRIVDYDDLENVWGYGFESKKIYNQSLISILSETNFYEDTGYLSEKIWKPIAHGHPFILVGPYHSLKFLKEHFGFKTFSPFIDERYDNEKDANRRMELIQKEIKRLNNYSLEELKELVENLKSTILYNKNLLFKYGSKKDIALDYLHYLRITSREGEANELLNTFISQNNSKNLI